MDPSSDQKTQTQDEKIPLASSFSPELNHNQRSPDQCDVVVKLNEAGSGRQVYAVPPVADGQVKQDGLGSLPSNQAKAAEANEEQQRETWGKKADFLLSIIGFAVDLANVWRFPYLCYRNGGGAFLIPYFIMLVFAAVPLFFLELVLGQFHREGAVGLWKIAPIFTGIGICQCLVAYYVAFYYNVIIAWSVYYLVTSFRSDLPWTSCDNPWNTINCTVGPNTTDVSNNSIVTRPNDSTSAASEYFERSVLGLQHSDGVYDIGEPRWQLVLCLMFVFVMLYFSLWKGVKSSGKVVWVTATMPYVVLSILLVRGVLLPGAREGIIYYITPDLSRLSDPKVWNDAAVQIFYSTGAGFGVHIAYASYNKFSNNCYKDCLATACVNCFTSLFSGFVIFSYLGYMAKKMGTDVSTVAAEGPGLVFVVYPEAIASMPGSVGWSIIFFLMLITLGLDSAKKLYSDWTGQLETISLLMGGLEAVLTGFGDVYRAVLKKKTRFWREIVTGVVCFSAFLFALPNVTNGGIYLFHMWDTFAAGTALLCGVFAQAVAVAWFYGMDQLCADVEKMLGFRPNLFWRICWKFVSPTFLFVVIVSSIVTYSPLNYESFTMGVYEYPSWANAVGWLIAASSMICIPAYASYKFITIPNCSTWQKRLAVCISPYWEHSSIRNGGKVTRFQRKHWLSV